MKPPLFLIFRRFFYVCQAWHCDQIGYKDIKKFLEIVVVFSCGLILYKTVKKI